MRFQIRIVKQRILLLSGLVGLLTPAGAQSTPPGIDVPRVAAEANPNPGTRTNGTELRLNFRGASLESVLQYLSEAAGFIIDLQTSVKGKIDVWSGQPVSQDDALALLNSALDK